MCLKERTEVFDDIKDISVCVDDLVTFFFNDLDSMNVFGTAIRQIIRGSEDLAPPKIIQGIELAKTTDNAYYRKSGDHAWDYIGAADIEIVSMADARSFMVVRQQVTGRVIFTFDMLANGVEFARRNEHDVLVCTITRDGVASLLLRSSTAERAERFHCEMVNAAKYFGKPIDADHQELIRLIRTQSSDDETIDKEAIKEQIATKTQEVAAKEERRAKAGERPIFDRANALTLYTGPPSTIILAMYGSRTIYFIDTTGVAHLLNDNNPILKSCTEVVLQ